MNDDSQPRIELNANHRAECHLCNLPYFPELAQIKASNFLCTKCNKGYAEEYDVSTKRHNNEAKKRKALEDAYQNPSFMILFLDWLDASKKPIDVLQKQSLMFLKRTRMMNRANRQVENSRSYVPPWL